MLTIKRKWLLLSFLLMSLVIMSSPSVGMAEDEASDPRNKVAEYIFGEGTDHEVICAGWSYGSYIGGSQANYGNHNSCTAGGQPEPIDKIEAISYLEYWNGSSWDTMDVKQNSCTLCRRLSHLQHSLLDAPWDRVPE
ncbi:MAG: hypothetical protein HY532_02200 [Chloroflexi bacterium]|nr:hypothetical protein [Chloroflexota bacterium]